MSINYYTHITTFPITLTQALLLPDPVHHFPAVTPGVEVVQCLVPSTSAVLCDED